MSLDFEMQMYYPNFTFFNISNLDILDSKDFACRLYI